MALIPVGEIKVMAHHPERCPNCGNETTAHPFPDLKGAFVVCSLEECGMAGPTLPNMPRAIQWWNKLIVRARLTPIILRAAIRGDQKVIEECAQQLDEVEGREWRSSQ
jgi:hypothetical protein